MRKRDYKDFAKGGIYHIYNRGVDKMDIFKNAEDFRIFQLRMEENLFPERVDRSKFSRIEKRRKLLPKNSFDLICYCLMPNHFHLIVQQLTDLPLSKLMLKICTSYSMYFNKKYDRIGTLFQDQFKAVLIENNEQLLWTSFYVHKNPIEAQLVNQIKEYEWNSYLDYVNFNTKSLCKQTILLDQFKSREKFVEHFETSLKSKEYLNKGAGFQDILIDY